MPLINCIVELKFKWTKYCVLFVADNENDINEDANVNNIYSLSKRQNYMFCTNFISKKQLKNIKTSEQRL